MEVVGITRMKNGKEVDEFVLRCQTHDAYYTGRPPLIHGCAECWEIYLVGQVAQSPKDKRELVDQLESVIKHSAELEDKGLWDFVPDHKVEFGHED